MYADIHAAVDRDKIESVTLGSDEVIVSLSDEVAVRGTADEVTAWALTVAKCAVVRMAPDQMMTFMRSMLMDTLADMTPPPDDLSGL